MPRWRFLGKIAYALFVTTPLLTIPMLGSALGAPQKIELHSTRLSSLDLAIGGDLPGIQPGGVRYLTIDQLRRFEQVNFTASADPDLPKNANIAGVALETIAAALGAPAEDVVVVTCTDKYQVQYARDYIATHSPILVLLINGKPLSEGPNKAMAPYVVVHRNFTPSFRILGHPEQRQTPWGVVRLDFRGEKVVFGPIAPRGLQADNTGVQNGYALARQNCFRCHNMGGEGGQKAQISWLAIAAIATTAPDFFSAYVRNPQTVNKNTKMEASPDYDDATMTALAAYFRSFIDRADSGARPGAGAR